MIPGLQLPNTMQLPPNMMNMVQPMNMVRQLPPGIPMQQQQIPGFPGQPR